MTSADTPAPRAEQPPTATAHTDSNDAAARLRIAVRDAFAGAGARPAEIEPRDLVVVFNNRITDISVILHNLTADARDEIAPALRDRLLRAARGAT